MVEGQVFRTLTMLFLCPVPKNPGLVQKSMVWFQKHSTAPKKHGPVER